MLEVMRKLICLLLMWNLCLTVSFGIYLHQQQKETINQEICNAELIPLEIIEEF